MTHRIDISIVDEEPNGPLAKRVRESVVLSAEKAQRQEAILWALSILDKLLPPQVAERFRPDVDALEQQGRTKDASTDAPRASIVATMIMPELRGYIASIIANPEQMWFNGNAEKTCDSIRATVERVLSREGV